MSLTTVHREDVKALLRKRYGSIENFAVLVNVEAQKVRDLLRGKSDVTKAVVAREFGIEPDHLVITSDGAGESGELEDVGFVDRAAVKRLFAENATLRAALLPEYERRRASIIGRQAEILIELIDQRIELQRVLQRPFGAGLGGKVGGYLLKFVERIWPAAAEKLHHRDLEIAQEADLAVQLAEAVFLHSFVDRTVHGFGFREIAFEEMEERIPVPAAAHRLSGGAK